MTNQEYIKYVNDMRKAEPNKWQFVVAEDVQGKRIEHKFYGTLNQVLRVDGIQHNTLYELNIGQWKQEILTALNYKEPQ
jgi:hypothetical protein